jgi:biopolymer transport protein ExbB
VFNPGRIQYVSFIAIFFAVDAIAQESAKMIPVTQVIKDGGWTMVALGVLSLLATFMVVYFLLTLRLNVILPHEFAVEAEEIADRGDMEALYLACQRNHSAGATIIGSAARVLRENPEIGYMVIRDVIEDEGSRQSNALWQRIQYLMDVAIIAPMVGLLGTVLGMIQAFIGLQSDFGAVKPIALANGVSKALATTAGGLIVGIISMLLYSYFRGHVTLLVTTLEERCSLILQRFIFKRK